MFTFSRQRNARSNSLHRPLAAESLEDRRLLSTGSAFPEVAEFGNSKDWGLNRLYVPEVWEAGYTGNGVVVAVVDTGVQTGHPDLNLWFNPGEIRGNRVDDDRNGYIDDSNGWDFVENDNEPRDPDGHGTNVAGIIASQNDGVGSTGVAPGARLMVLRVLNQERQVYNVAVAIRYAVDNGADIINISLGSTDPAGFPVEALEYATEHDVLVVAASGNSSSDVPIYPALHSADLPNVISVGAHDRNGNRVSFSNQVGETGAVQVDAPGLGLRSTNNELGYSGVQGTSMAAPHVAGIAALALSANPSLTAIQLHDLIIEGANQAVIDTDSLGGVNASATVALALGMAVETSPWHNYDVITDVDGNGTVNPLDILLVINYLITNLGNGDLLGEPAAFIDVNCDGIASPLDALIVINKLEKEAAPEAAAIPVPDLATAEVSTQSDLGWNKLATVSSKAPPTEAEIHAFARDAWFAQMHRNGIGDGHSCGSVVEWKCRGELTASAVEPATLIEEQAVGELAETSRRLFVAGADGTLLTAP